MCSRPSVPQSCALSIWSVHFAYNVPKQGGLSYGEVQSWGRRMVCSRSRCPTIVHSIILVSPFHRCHTKIARWKYVYCARGYCVCRGEKQLCKTALSTPIQFVISIFSIGIRVPKFYTRVGQKYNLSVCCLLARTSQVFTKKWQLGTPGSGTHQISMQKRLIENQMQVVNSWYFVLWSTHIWFAISIIEI